MSRIWAVARQMISEGLRMRIALFFLAVLALLMTGAYWIRGDNTQVGAVKAFLSYSLTAVTLVLSLLTLFQSRSLSDELSGRQIFLLMTKPLPRWQYMVGKWLGIVVLNACFLAIAGGVIYGTTLYLAGRGSELQGDAEQVRSEVLVARHSTPFIVPDFTRQADRLFEQRREEGAYFGEQDLDENAAKDEIRQNMEQRWRSVMPNEQRRFEFKGLRFQDRPDLKIQIRYFASAYGVPGDEIIRSVWYVGNPDKGTELYEFPLRHVVNRYQVIEVRADSVAKDGTLTVHVLNRNPYPNEPQFNTVMTFEATNGIEVLFVVGGFGGNLSRLLLLILCRLMFLAALGLLTTSVFSFPVAALVSLTVYTLAESRVFLDEAFEFFQDSGLPPGLDAVVTFAVQGVFTLLKGLYTLIPDFAQYNAVELLIDGRNVTLMWVLAGVLWVVIVRTGIVLLAACLLFQRREVAEVSV